MQMPRSTLFHLIVEKRKKRVPEKVAAKFDIGNITGVTASSRTKLRSVWD